MVLRLYKFCAHLARVSRAKPLIQKKFLFTFKTGLYLVLKNLLTPKYFCRHPPFFRRIYTTTLSPSFEGSVIQILRTKVREGFLTRPRLKRECSTEECMRVISIRERIIRMLHSLQNFYLKESALRK